MIRIFGARVAHLPSWERMVSTVGEARYAAWRQAHPTARAGESAARESLGGLYLLARAGAEGSLLYTGNGRPYLDAPLDVSFTHSAGFVFCAVEEGSDARLGVDAESAERIPKSRIASLSERWFSEGERALLEGADDAIGFLRIWTRKEALLKFCGEGLSAMRECDTVAKMATGEIGFAEYAFPCGVLTLCHKAAHTAPEGILWMREES